MSYDFAIACLALGLAFLAIHIGDRRACRERKLRIAAEIELRDANGLISQLSASNARACHAVNAIRATLREADETDLAAIQAQTD
jgi:hypothetical protein